MNPFILVGLILLTLSVLLTRIEGGFPNDY